MPSFGRGDLVLQRGPEIGGVGCESEPDRGRVRHEDEARPSLGRERGKRLDAKRLGIGTVESIGQRLLQFGDFGDLAVPGVGLASSHEGGKVAPEPTRAPLVGRVGGNVAFTSLAKARSPR